MWAWSWVNLRLGRAWLGWQSEAGRRSVSRGGVVWAVTSDLSLLLRVGDAGSAWKRSSWLDWQPLTKCGIMIVLIIFAGFPG